MGRVVILDTVCFKNFDEITLSCMVKETEAISCFALFVTNLKIDNDPIFGRVNVLEIGSATQSYPVGKDFIEITLSSTVFEVQAFLCFSFLKKI